MIKTDRSQVASRRHPMRQWLGIEFSAYIVLCVVLITVAWTQNHISGAVALAAWIVAGIALLLAAREIYRRRQR